MHLRRALLLFAIVLGLAAVAASVTRTERGRPAPAPAPPAPSGPAAAPAPAPDPGTRTVQFRPGPPSQVRKLVVNQAATVVVAAPSFGQAQLENVGARPVEPGTPASFDVFRTRPQKLAVLFLPATGGHPLRVGTLRVVARR